MKLYELPRGSMFTVNTCALLTVPDQQIYVLDHIDGMYSVCHDGFGQIVHWSASTPVTLYEPTHSEF